MKGRVTAGLARPGGAAAGARGRAGGAGRRGTRPGDRPEPGGCYVRAWWWWAGDAMKWRSMLELAGPDGTRQVREVGAGERSPTGHAAATLGLSLAEGKALLAA